MLSTVLIIIATIICVLVGIIVVLRNPKQAVNRVYGVATTCIIIFQIANHLSLHTEDRLWLMRIVLFSTTVLLGAVFYLILYIKRNNKLTYMHKAGIAVTFFVAILDLTPLVFGGITKGNNPTPVASIAAPLYIIHFVLFTLFSIMLLLKRISKTDGSTRQQFIVMAIGLAPVLIFAPVTSFIMPVVLGDAGLVWISPVYAVFFVTMIGYAIVRHRLFDVKNVVVRSAGYVLSLGIIILGYLAITVGVGQRITSLQQNSFWQLSLYTFGTLFLAVMFQPLKSWFDRVTNKVFYRDAYDSQEVIDQVGSVIVGSIDSRKIQRGTAEVLSGALRPTFLAFLFMSDSRHVKEGVVMGGAWRLKDPATFEKNLKYIKERLVLFDELEEGSQDELKEVLRSEDIGFVLPLITKTDKIGYLVGGQKKSGNIYNSQDVKLLNIAANELAVALQNAQRFEEIKAFNLVLQEKVNDATKELKITNKKLIALDEAKDEFISMASHQLRTPLTSIKGYVSMMLDGDLGKMNEQQEKAMNEAYSSSQRMVFLIADFLNVSRIKTGKFMIEPSSVDLPKMVEEEITQLREMAASRDVAISYDPPSGFPILTLDENKTRQVMMNMVDNAIYYTPAGGRITIQLYHTGSDVIFKVIDTGIGVPKVDQHKMFTKFFRASNARKARPDGTGLGLFMAQKVIVAQGGVVIFESTEGKGSTFGFRFPLSKVLSK